MRIIKIIILLLGLTFVSSTIRGQDFNSERIAWIKYLQRMYKASPFEGVRVVEDAEDTYLISVLALDSSKYQQNTLHRVALVKAQAQANRFFNDSKVITSEMIIHVDGSNSDPSVLIEKTSVDTHGYVKGMELVSSFPDDGGNTIFIFASQIK